MQKLGLHNLWEDVILLSHLADVERSLCEEEVGNATALSQASPAGDGQCRWLTGHLAQDKGWSGGAASPYSCIWLSKNTP